MSEKTQEELLERIKQLELVNKAVQSELSQLKSKLSTADANSTTHELKVTVRSADGLYGSDPVEINGVHFVLSVQKLTVDGHNRERAEQHFFYSMHATNTSGDKGRFVYSTIDVHLDRGHRHATPEDIHSTTEQFVLSQGEQQTGKRIRMECVHPGHFVAKLMAVVQPIEMAEIDGESATVVVVKNKRFNVSADYLSQWSLFFDAYFRADMKEKKEGVFPIKDDDISPEDFQLLLDVIHPTQKAIDEDNYMLILKLASRFIMPSLTRKIELFMIDFARNDIDKATAFRVATDLYALKIVESVLLHRWRDAELLKKELMTTEEYKKLSAETKALVNDRFTQACLSQEDQSDGRRDDRRDDRRTGRRSDRSYTAADYERDDEIWHERWQRREDDRYSYRGGDRNDDRYGGRYGRGSGFGGRDRGYEDRSRDYARRDRDDDDASLD